MIVTEFKVISKDYLEEGNCWIFILENAAGGKIKYATTGIRNDLFVYKDLSPSLEESRSYQDCQYWVNDSDYYEDNLQELAEFLGIDEDDFDPEEFEKQIVKKMKPQKRDGNIYILRYVLEDINYILSSERKVFFTFEEAKEYWNDFCFFRLWKKVEILENKNVVYEDDNDFFEQDVSEQLLEMLGKDEINWEEVEDFIDENGFYLTLDAAREYLKKKEAKLCFTTTDIWCKSKKYL